MERYTEDKILSMAEGWTPVHKMMDQWMAANSHLQPSVESIEEVNGQTKVTIHYKVPKEVEKVLLGNVRAG